MADNFVTCRHCGIGIWYACDHSDDDVPAQDHAVLQADTSLLRAALRQATESLETVGRDAGRNEFMDTMFAVRAYANARAGVARAALAGQEVGRG